jgi:Leucine-rich repeat (LRR) protein
MHYCTKYSFCTNFKDNGIFGEITQDMISGGWQSMVDLDLSFNRLDGPLPKNIWSMESLEVVDLHGNDFIGQIPEVDAVHDNLIFFAVQDNSLEWRIPESINNLVNLKHLDISANNMALPFPPTMSEMSNLESFYTGINGFGKHQIPDFLAQMTNLRELSMKQNQLTGQIPAFIGAMTNLKVLDLDFNQLTGKIPDVSRTLVTEILRSLDSRGEGFYCF